MEGKNILVVEDDPDILRLIKFNLEKEGYKVFIEEDGEKGIKTAFEVLPDIVMLDVMLPGVNGLEICKFLKREEKTKDIPVIILTAKSEDSDIVAGLDIGADDYIVKPFSPRVLLARIKAVLRRNGTGEQADTPALSSSTFIKVHDIKIDTGKHEVLVKGEPVVLTFSEFKILILFAKYPGWVFSRDQIVSALHGEGYPVTDRAVDVQIVGLRKKLGKDYIETIRGIGYRLKEKI